METVDRSVCMTMSEAVSGFQAASLVPLCRCFDMAIKPTVLLWTLREYAWKQLRYLQSWLLLRQHSHWLYCGFTDFCHSKLICNNLGPLSCLTLLHCVKDLLQLKLKNLVVRQRRCPGQWASQGSDSAPEYRQVVTANGRERA